MSKKPLWTFTAIFIVFAIIICVFQGYQLCRDLDAVIDRAQVGADREDIVEYMTQLKVNMENKDCTTGHTALIFKTPINDMSLHYRAVNKILARLESISDLSKNETAYQVALEDIRGIIRELPNPSSGLLWVRYLWWMLSIATVLIIVSLTKEGDPLSRY